MKKRTIIITICAAVVLITACKKDKEAVPLSATGYWKGQAVYYEVVLINKEDGNVGYYIAVPNGDTATATAKLYGTYVLNGNLYKAMFPSGTDTSFIEATLREHEPGFMKGYFFAKSVPGTKIPLELWK